MHLYTSHVIIVGSVVQIGWIVLVGLPQGRFVSLQMPHGNLCGQ